MRSLLLLVLGFAVLGFSGCACKGRRTCGSQRAHSVPRQVQCKSCEEQTCDNGPSWSHAVNRNNFAQPQVGQSYAAQSDCGCQTATAPMVGDQCGCQPSEIVEYGVPTASGMMLETNSNLPQGLELQLPTNDSQFQSSPSDITPLEQNGLDYDPEGKLEIQGYGVPGIGMLSPKNLADERVPFAGKMDKIPNLTSRMVGPAELDEAPELIEPVKKKIKAIPVSAVVSPPTETMVESVPEPFAEMGEEEAKEASTIELPADNKEYDSFSEPIVLRAIQSRWLREKSRVEPASDKELAANKLRTPERQASLTGNSTDYYGLPASPAIQFSDLPPMDSQTVLPVKLPQSGSAGSAEDLENLPRIDFAPQTQDKTTQLRKIEIDTAKNFVVESTAFYRPAEMGATNNKPSRILRLSAVTGTGESKVDQRASFAAFKMVSPVIVRGGYAANEPTAKTHENVSRAIGEDLHSKPTLRLLDR